MLDGPEEKWKNIFAIFDITDGRMRQMARKYAMRGFWAGLIIGLFLASIIPRLTP